MKIKELKQGDYFTLKAVEFPNDSQVYVRGEYCKAEKKYNCYKFDDISREHLFKGEKEVFTEFVF